jgi:hypothetical protein
MARHYSKSPWKLVHEGHGTFIRAAHGGVVASMEAGYQTLRDIDGRLVEVAPEMLEALKLAVKYLGHPDVKAIPFSLPSGGVAKRIQRLIDYAERT